MRRKTVSKLIIYYFISCLATDTSYAAGMIARVQQMKAMKQQQSQAEYQQYQQQENQTQSQQPAAPPTYQQTVDQRNQAIAQAITDTHNPAVSSTYQTQATGVVPKSSASNEPYAQVGPADIKEVVDLAEVWKKLDKKSTAWTLLIDNQAKILTVSEYMDRFHKEGVKINQPPLHYVQMIDQIVGGNPQMLQRPFGELLQIAAIVDYDFDNGMDKDELAKKVLGEQGFEANKRRFGQQ